MRDTKKNKKIKIKKCMRRHNNYVKSTLKKHRAR